MEKKKKIIFLIGIAVALFLIWFLVNDEKRFDDTGDFTMDEFEYYHHIMGEKN